MPPAGGEYRAEQVSYLAGLVHRRQTEPAVGEYLAELLDKPARGRSRIATPARSSTISSATTTRRRSCRRRSSKSSPAPRCSASRSGPRRGKANDFAQFPAAARKRRSSSRSRKPRRSATKTCRTTRCSTNTSRARRRPKCAACSPSCASSWCRWWRRSSRAAGSRTWTSCVAAIRSTRRSDSACTWPRRSASISTAGRLDVTAPSVLLHVRPARRAAHHALRRRLLPQRALQHPARSGPRHLRAGPAGRPIRPADRRSGVARHPRVAVADVGEPGRPQPGVLGALLPAKRKQAFPEALRRRAARRVLFCDQRRAAVADSHRGRRGDVQPAHHGAVRAGAGAAARRAARRRSAGRVEREVSRSTWASSRRPMPTACCRTSTGAPGWSAISRPTRSATSTRPSSSKRPRPNLGDLAAMFRRGEFLPLRDWLRTNVHEPGRRYAPAELVRRVTGEGISHGPLMRHLRGKFGPLYGLSQ